MPTSSKQSLAKMIVSQFTDFMSLLLFAAAAVSVLLGHASDGVAIAAVLVLNGIIGFVQEYRAERAIDALKNLAAPTAKVLRNGEPLSIPPADLVLGDIIILSTGDLVTADALLMECTNLHTDESMLTGESLPVEKRLGTIKSDAPLAERTNMVFSGTLVTSGHALALVSAVGAETQLGQIAKLLVDVRQHLTPLQKRLRDLSIKLTWLVAIICLVIATMYISRGYIHGDQINWLELVFASIGLAVAAIPEGLPAAITIALALGAQRMANRKAIVRQLASVETLGSVSVICTDKTGTLTQNKMSVAFTKSVGPNTSDKEAAALAAILCNNAKLDSHNQIHGSATESAILRDAIVDHPERIKWQTLAPRLKELPFSSDRKRMSTVHSIDGIPTLFCKGAVEMVLSLCTKNSPNDIVAETNDLANRGFRVLGYASKTLPLNWHELSAEQLETDLTFLGFVVLQDPLRSEASDAISKCHDAGIKVIMLTGDHVGTARHIANELNLGGDEHRVVTGIEIDRMANTELRKTLRSQRVFARVSPNNKLAIVNALLANNDVVAMTGDGINDAPALKQADVGVAMGINGTEVSKQAAKIVLADDNFATIVAAIEEGRLVYANIQKFVTYLLTGNLSEVLIIFFGVAMGFPIPLLPIHLLWINLVTDGIPALALAFTPAGEDLMRRPPRPTNASILSSRQIIGVALNGSIFAAISLAIYTYFLFHSQSESYARTTALLSIAQLQLTYSLSFTNKRGLLGGRKLFRNIRLWVAVIVSMILQFAIIYIPTLQKFFATESLAGTDLAVIMLTALMATALTNLTKVRRRPFSETAS